MKTSIACICFKERSVFIALRNPTGDMGNRWEFPGGKVEEGETDESSIVREMKEEFGVDVKVGSFIGGAVFKHSGKDVNLHAYEVFFPHDGMDKKFVLTEHQDYKWVPLSEIPELNFVDSDMLIYPQVLKYFVDNK